MAYSKRKAKKLTPKSLANAALFYLQRYAASEAGLRRVLENKLRRAAMRDEAFAQDDQAQVMLRQAIDAIVETHKRTGIINDAAFAEMKVSSLRRGGTSARRIAQKLALKGIKQDLVSDVLEQQAQDHGATSEEAEEQAALHFARRRGLGPFRKVRPQPLSEKEEAALRNKEIASMARAGFSFDTAKKVLGGGEDVF